MPKTLTDLRALDAGIYAAMAALHGARAAADHSPNCETKAAMEKAQDRVDELLDRRLDATR
jgi:DNA-binding IscR family transcriptional regulator